MNADPDWNWNRRQQALVDLVKRQGFMTVDQLAEHFEVTAQTIRRDLNALCDQGQLRRHHGGVSPPSSVENLAYATRRVLQHEEKRRMATCVAGQIPDGASLFINLGTTTEAVARALRDHRDLRIVTNSLKVAVMLADNPTFEIIVAGGMVRGRDHGVTGEATIELIRQFKVDFGVIGISAIDLDGTLLDFDYSEVRVAEAIVANSRCVYLVADHTKVGRKAMVRLGHFAQVHTWFTDRAPPEPLLQVLERAGTRLHVVDASQERVA